MSIQDTGNDEQKFQKNWTRRLKMKGALDAQEL
jgi:hypothetical protein